MKTRFGVGAGKYGMGRSATKRETSGNFILTGEWSPWLHYQASQMAIS